MPTQNLFGVPLVNPMLGNGSSAFTTSGVLNATNTAYAAFFMADDIATHGAIVGCVYSCSALVGTPTFTASLQGVTSAGTPDGVIKGGGTPASVDFTPSVGVTQLTFANSFTPAIGDALCIVIVYKSGATSATFNARVTNVSNICYNPYSGIEAAGVWTSTQSPPMIAPVYADGFVGRGCPAAKTSFNNVTASTSYGSLWVPSQNCVLDGCYVSIRPVSGSKCQIIVYEGTSTTISSLTNVSQSANEDCITQWQQVNTAGNVVFIPLPRYTLVAGRTYRFVVLNSGTAYTTFASMSFTTQALIQAFWGPMTGTIGTTTTFTDYNSGSDWRAFPVIPCIDSFAVTTPEQSFASAF